MAQKGELLFLDDCYNVIVEAGFPINLIKIKLQEISMNKFFNLKLLLLLILGVIIFPLQFISCGSGDNDNDEFPILKLSITVTDGPRDYRLSWDANREEAVNTPGGGYSIYYGTREDFNIGDSDVISLDVPYVSGEYSPTSQIVNLNNGTWYFLIKAYSAL